MLAYVARRLVQAAFILVLLSVVTRALLNAMPGDPLDSLRKSSRVLSEEDLERLKKHYGLDDPFYLQYVKWVGQLATGDLGYSRTYKVPVSQLLWPALGRTLLLMGISFVLAVFLSLFLGMRSAVVPGSPDDRFIRFLCYLGISVPTFWLCLVAVQWLAVRWHWFPPDAQMLPDENSILSWITHLFLPVSVVTFQLTAEWTRYVRSGLRDVLHADHLRAARARGLSETRILWIHALPNALTPFATVLGLSLPYLVGGELVVEMVFAWPGLGLLEYNAIRQQDYNVAMATLMMITFFTLLGSLLADLVHALLDPRVRAGISS